MVIVSAKGNILKLDAGNMYVSCFLQDIFRTSFIIVNFTSFYIDL